MKPEGPTLRKIDPEILAASEDSNDFFSKNIFFKFLTGRLEKGPV